MDPKDAAEQAEAVYQVFNGDPWLFVGALLVIGAVMFGAMYAGFRAHYKGIIENKDATIGNLNSRIELLQHQIEDRARATATEPLAPTQPRSDDEKSAGYNPTWDKVDAFALWQAAWLWVGQEPKPEVTDGTPAYPVFRMLKAAAIEGTLPVTRERKQPGITWGRAIELASRPAMVDAWSIATRADLKEFAESKNEYPDFLQ